MSRDEPAPTGARVLVVDDDATLRELLDSLLSDAGYQVSVAGAGDEALRILDESRQDVVLLDLHMPRMGGSAVLAALPSVRTDARVIVMTAFGTVDAAVEAMKLGAWDFVTKPFQEDDVLRLVARAAEDVSLRRELAELRRLAPSDRLRDLIGRSDPMKRLFRVIERVAPTRASVLITGETGTGKELVAHAIHDLGSRSRKPFVPVNCSALPGSLLEAELFGFMKGSFTGAVQSRSGLIEEAAGGTLFLDEVSTLSEDTQVKLLRVLQDREVQRIGSRTSQKIDFRVIAATNADLSDLVAEGRFREDLFYRLNVFPVEVPPLRDRPDDIPLLAEHFRTRFAQEQGVEPPPLSPETLARMRAHAWPGNVRQLEGFMERAVILASDGGPIVFDLAQTASTSEPAVGALRLGLDEEWPLDRLEREYILSVLERVQGQRTQAVEILGISRRTLYRKLEQYRAAGYLAEESVGGADRP